MRHIHQFLTFKYLISTRMRQELTELQGEGHKFTATVGNSIYLSQEWIDKADRK